ncbi:MAG: nuclear transport factor 2 family protein [Candidatus Eremiobacteraeota bacterium]|nr:nuclear transport factor 2 family protein [Candidatus Eremiobacteraeota bacterium]
MPAEQSANEQTVRRIYDAFNARDIGLLASLFANDCTTTDMGTGRTYTGFAGFMEWVKPFADALPDSTATPVFVIEAGDWIATEHVGRGTQTGTFVTPDGDVPASNRPIEIKFAEFFRLHDGKVAEFRAYWDSGSVVRQMR